MAGARWLGVGLAAVLAAVTLGLAVTGRLQLYINPAQAWFAVGMAVLALAGAVWSCTLPLGAENDHGHDHGHGAADDPAHGDHAHGGDSARSTRTRRRTPRRLAGGALVVAGGVIASAVAVAALVLPPASLSVDLAMDRDTGTPPLFGGADTVTLAASGDTSSFGIGEWATVFATATNPDAYTGQEVTLTGFVTPDEETSGVRLGRLVITHCVIDAQPASIPVASGGAGLGADEADLEAGQWIEVEGTITADAAGALSVEPTAITPIDEPEDPYEY
ncbi:TIGR03943 family protein [Microbacterium oryzae]|uniref:TIGR03943 family protein n=2 Tax=Microbacterium oryzae TaxID=743009 RepID=A0A6I6DSN9_9MICO|nr:TIGR03943 family protein [Microbacterium oryzae]